MSSKKDKYGKVVEQLVADFWFSNREKLKREEGQITQDFISRRMMNNTARVSKLVRANREYLRQLVEYVIERLEKDFPRISPKKSKDYFLRAVEDEYTKLNRKVPGWLQESGLLSELKQFQNGVTTCMTKAKKDLQNKCALWELRWRQKRKWYCDPKWVVGIVLAVVLAVLSWFVPGWLRGNAGHVGPETPSKIIRDTPIDPNTGKTALYSRTKKRVDELRDSLIKEKITPWLLMKSGDRVTNHDGRILQYSDVEFTGTPRQIFWEGFIEPFLEDGIQEVLDEVGAECKNMGLDPENPLKEAAWLLRSVIESVYNKMAKVDQTLRGKGYPDSVRRKNVDYEIRIMETKLQEYLKAALVLYGMAPE